MILSMTGYGKAERIENSFTLSIEVRALNSKFFDCQMKLPREFSVFEIELRKIIEQRLERGKIAISVEFLSKSEAPERQTINEELFLSYYRLLKNLAEKVNEPNAEIFKTAMFLPDVLNPVTKLASGELESIMQDTMIEALDRCQDYRI